MERLIADNAKNGEVIFPYIGGEEVNSSPVHSSHRYVINLGVQGEEQCRREWPDLMAILEKKVKPERDKLRDNSDGKQYKKFWWRFGRPSPALFMAIEGRNHVLVNSQVSTHICFSIIQADQVYGHTLYVYPYATSAHLAAMQSSAHAIWGAFQGSSLGDGIRYTAASSFETFPFPVALLDSIASEPANAAQRHRLEAVGERYHQFRAELMVSNNEGLTRTYNRFHDPAETSSELLELRRLHGEMDQAVLVAYSWSDVPTNCGFGLDYLDIEDDIRLPDALQERIDSGELFFWDANDALNFQGQLQAHGAITGRRKLPWRYRWPDAVRDDVLARLLALNAERYEEEMSIGLHSKAGKKADGAGSGGKRRGRPPQSSQLDSGTAAQIGLAL